MSRVDVRIGIPIVPPLAPKPQAVGFGTIVVRVGGPSGGFCHQPLASGRMMGGQCLSPCPEGAPTTVFWGSVLAATGDRGHLALNSVPLQGLERRAEVVHRLGGRFLDLQLGGPHERDLSLEYGRGNLIHEREITRFANDQTLRCVSKDP